MLEGSTSGRKISTQVQVFVVLFQNLCLITHLFVQFTQVTEMPLLHIPEYILLQNANLQGWSVLMKLIL